LVLELHGSGLTASDQMSVSGFAKLGAAAGFVTVAPEAAIPLRLSPHLPQGFAWNIPGAPLVGFSRATTSDVDDAAFIAVLIDTLVAEGIVEPLRIYVAGFSGGARFVSYLAAVMPEKIAAIGAVAGLRLSPWLETPPPPMIAFHGIDDPLNPFSGGPDSRWDLGVNETARAFAGKFGWMRRPAECQGDVTLDTYIDRDDIERLVQYTIAHAGHGWPGSSDFFHIREFGPVSSTIDATASMWHFFSRRRPNQRPRLDKTIS
jgi:polyhydroxybutyrate depolymerase